MAADDDPIPNSDSPLTSSEESALSPDNPASQFAELPQRVLSEVEGPTLSGGLSLSKAEVEGPALSVENPVLREEGSNSSSPQPSTTPPPVMALATSPRYLLFQPMLRNIIGTIFILLHYREAETANTNCVLVLTSFYPSLKVN